MDPQKKSLIFVSSDDLHIVRLLIDHLGNHYPLIYRSLESIPHAYDHTRVRKIKESALHLLPQVKETITQAVIHVGSAKDKKLIRDMFSKFRADRTHLILLLPIRAYQHNIDIIQETKHYDLATYIFYGDLYGNGLPYTYSPVAKRLHFAFNNKVFTLEGDDLNQIFPIHTVDFLTLIRDLAEKNIEGHYFFSFYEKPETVLSLAHYMKRAEPELSLMIKHDSPLRFTEDNRQTLIQDMRHRFLSQVEYQKNHALGFEKSLHQLAKQPSEKSYATPQNKLSLGGALYYSIVMLGVVFFIFDLLLLYVILSRSPNIFLFLKW